MLSKVGAYLVLTLLSLLILFPIYMLILRALSSPLRYINAGQPLYPVAGQHLAACHVALARTIVAAPRNSFSEFRQLADKAPVVRRVCREYLGSGAQAGFEDGQLVPLPQ